MHRAVADGIDQPRLIEDHPFGDLLEGWLMDEGTKVVLVGEVKAPVCLVHPLDRALQRTACIEASSARIGERYRLSLGSRLIDIGPLRREEIKVTHNSPRKARFWREEKRASSFARAFFCRATVV